MLRFPRLLALSLVCTVVGASPSTASETAGPTGVEVMRRSDEAARSSSEHQITRMVLIDKRGRERERKLEGWSQEVDENSEKRFARFLEPADIKDTALLTYDYQQKDDDIWLYLPALKKVKRILSSDKTDKFMGSDFSYWDMENLDFLNWKYTLGGSESLEGAETWKVEGKPVNDEELAESGYSQATYWVGKEDFVARRVEFVDKKGRLAKRLTATDIRMVGENDPEPRAHRLKMENLLNGHSTVLELSEVEVDVEVDAKIFSQRNLRQ